MAERFSVERVREAVWPGEVLLLRDRAAGSWARVLPGLGCNLVGFGAALGGREVETFLQPSDEATPLAPGSYGAPVLFPFPNRLRGGRASFAGREIRIDLAPGQANAIHGLVRRHAWEVGRAGAEDGAAVVSCTIAADEDVLRQFPFPYRLSLTFRLAGTRLRIDVEAQNTGQQSMPLGFGWHPYFRMPLLLGGDRAAQVVQVPAARAWTLDAELIPTGETIAVPPERDFRRPRPIGTTNLDDVYSDVQASNGASACTLTDPVSGVTLRMAAGPSFREWVVFAPAHRPTICFEPYTCPTDAFNLAARGQDVGVIVLRPTEWWTDWMDLELGAGRATSR